MSTALAQSRPWKRPPLIRNAWLRWALILGALVYLVAALSSIEVNWVRVSEGLAQGWRFAQELPRAGFLHPLARHLAGHRGEPHHDGDLHRRRLPDLGADWLGAARNIAPLPIYAVCRAIIAISRAFQEVIIAILFVAMFGFGPFAGFLTLSFATIGFMAKLLAEDIEDISEVQAEAIRATGANWWQVINYGIQPQVFPRLIGLSLYRLDINFRESAVIGIVGAGGVGATLNTAMQRYDYSTAGAILIMIIVVVLIAEYASSHLRKWVQ